MAKTASDVHLRWEERATLENWVRASRTEQRTVVRARIVLMAADGLSNAEIGRRLSVRRATVSEWRSRFQQLRLAGLEDAPRSGAPKVYTAQTEARILAVLDEDPPPGHATWNGPLIAQRLGDVPKHQVWRILRQHGIQLQRRRSWCVSTDPEFAAKAVDIVGL